MSSTSFEKRIFTPALLLRDLGYLLARLPALVRALRNPEIGSAFAEKIMIVVTAINGCVYCSWFHAGRAVASGLSEREIGDMFELQFAASASRRELPALLYAQHYAETDRRPAPEMTERLKAFYGERTAGDIELLIRMIFFGNLLGNTFDAFPARLAGRPAANGNALFEALFFLATAWFMLPTKWLARGHHPKAATSAPEGPATQAVEPPHDGGTASRAR
jgi:AhpD family alkylhydroperoxidase